MEMPEIRQRKTNPGSPNVQTSPAPDPRRDPMPPPQSFWRRLSVMQWIILCIPLLAVLIVAAKNGQVQEANNASDSLTQADASAVFKHPIIKPVIRTTLGTNAGSSQDTTEPAINTCETPECDQLASDVQANMNYMVDPCDNFYDYACGRFINESDIPYDKYYVDRHTKIGDRLYDEVAALISSPEIRETDIIPFRLVKYLYQQCMDKRKIESDGTRPILAILEKLGGWYLLEKDGWTKPEPSWTLLKSVKTLRLHAFTHDHFIYPSVGVDWKNTSRMVIYLDQPTLGISRENLMRTKNTPVVFEYYDSMVNRAVALGADRELARRELSRSLEFEMELATITLRDDERQNASTLYNPMTVEELQSRYGYINWLDYFAVIFKDTGIVIDENEVVIVKAPNYMRKLGLVIRKTSNFTLTNYVMQRVTRFLSPFVTRKLQKRLPEYSTKLSPELDQKFRSMKCVNVTNIHLPIAVAALYVRRYYNDDARRATFDMVNKLKSAFVGILEEANWMNETTRNSCLEKVDSMAFHIGYPDELFDDRKIIEYYRDLEHKLWSALDYLSTVLYVKQFNMMQNLKMLRKTVNRTDWTTHSNQASLNVYYSYSENSVLMSTGLLQGLYLPHYLPRYMNYGTIGFLIGSQITRACDFHGQLTDKNGNLVDSWWKGDTHRNYMKKRRCFVKQYNKYAEPDTRIIMSGHTTADENIAVNGGIKVAYYAYKKWAKENGTEPRLPWLDQSPERMFWLSAAQTMCSKYRPEAMRNLITRSNRAPDRFRILGAMGNMVEFSEDFNCPSRSPMNRMVKCKVW